MENQVEGFLVTERIGIYIQPFAQCGFAHGLRIDTPAIIREHNNRIRTGHTHIHRYLANGRLATGLTLIRGLNTVVQGVAHHVLEHGLATGVVVAVQGTYLIGNTESDLLVEIITDGAYQAPQPRHQPGDGDYTGGADRRAD